MKYIKVSFQDRTTPFYISMKSISYFFISSNGSVHTIYFKIKENDYTYKYPMVFKSEENAEAYLKEHLEISIMKEGSNGSKKQ